ncbi:MAG TPA: hypothetical protein PKI66_08920, partial [Methanobacteriaceae archaeon]|nr:hypothetical protein [Methanobacteriaceae archaeon]
MPENECSSHVESTCSCCGGDLLEEKEESWKHRPLIIISTSAILFTAGIYLENILKLSLPAETLFLG